MLKLRSTRTPVWLLLATLGLVALTVTVTIADAAKNAPLFLHDPGLVAGTVRISLLPPWSWWCCSACSRSLRNSAAARSRRRTFANRAARASSSRSGCRWALASIVITAATLALSVTLAIALVGSRDGDARVAAQFWQMVAAGFVVMAAYGVIGVAVGALVRNQIAAVVGVLVWMNVVEQIVINSFPVVGRWMPEGAAYALLRLGPTINLDGKLLSASAGGLVLVGSTDAEVALAFLVAPRRDVL